MTPAPEIHCSPQIWREPNYQKLTEEERAFFFRHKGERAKSGRWPKGIAPEVVERLDAAWRANITFGSGV